MKEILGNWLFELSKCLVIGVVIAYLIKDKLSWSNGGLIGLLVISIACIVVGLYLLHSNDKDEKEENNKEK